MENIRAETVVSGRLGGGARARGRRRRLRDIGANDDTGKFAADGGSVFFAQMAASACGSP